jgi:hypothetical protein
MNGVRQGLLLGFLMSGVSGCGDGPTSTVETVEMNTLEYSGRFREYRSSGLVLERDLEEQEIRHWRHREIHYLLDTLRLVGGEFEFVANDVLWESESTDVGVDRFKTFRGNYGILGDSLYLAIDQAEYFGRDSLVFRYSPGIIRIEYCRETRKDPSTENPRVQDAPGACGSPDLTALADGEVLEQEDVLILFR